MDLDLVHTVNTPQAVIPLLTIGEEGSLAIAKFTLSTLLVCSLPYTTPLGVTILGFEVCATPQSQ